MHNRFYIEEKIDGYPNNEIVLESITGHIKAFRKKIGDEIKLYDGSGNIYFTKILQILKKNITVELRTKETRRERKSKIFLFLPVITSHIMDQLLARVCEMEVSNIFPVITERSINLKNEREISVKLSKWDKISKGAMILAGKNFSTVIHRPVILADVFKIANDFNVKLIANPEADLFLKDYLLTLDFKADNIKAAILIGPEGDFSPSELQLSKECGFMPVKLSNYIMSTFVSSLYSVSNLVSFAFSDDNYAS